MITKAEVQLVRALGYKKSREEHGLFVVEGEKLLEEVLASGLVVRNVFRGKDAERVSHLKTPAGVVGLVEIPRWEFNPADLRDRLVIALDEVQNPGNLGTIIRLADWFGVTDILCSEGCADCFNPKVVQATMGAITRVKVHYGMLPNMIARVSGGSHENVFGTFLDGENVYTSTLPQAGIVVFGSEGRGISSQVESLAGRRLNIPGVNPKAESLNVSVAAAITISEFRRR